MSSVHRWAAVVCWVLCASVRPALAEEQPLFAEDAVLAVTIAAPLGAVQAERDSGEYHEGTLTYRAADGAQHELDIKLRARGRYRRQARTCRFPPIRLNFRKKQLDGTVFEGQDKLKLVTHCRTGNIRYEQQLVKEYLAYRFLQMLTDTSFRSRLLRVNWRDSEDPDEDFEHYAFLIEDEDLLGERLGLPAGEVQRTRVAKLDGEQATLVSVFQYLIGNTDFSMLAGPADDTCCHNVVLYDRDGKFLPVPYDFDFSGFVDAPYAAPHPTLKIRSVKTRLYRGRCEHNDMLEPTLARFLEKRDAIFGLLDSQEGLRGRERRDARRYIEEFFDTIDNRRRIESRLVKKCV